MSYRVSQARLLQQRNRRENDERVVSDGSFNLCPSEVCNPETGDSHCEVPGAKSSNPVEFHPYLGVPESAVDAGKRLMAGGHLDVGGIEYLEATPIVRKQK
jgi:hypothetical protein